MIDTMTILRALILIICAIFLVAPALHGQTSFPQTSYPQTGVYKKALPVSKPLTLRGVIESSASGTNTPILIKFYTDWCGPCKYFEEDLKVGKLGGTSAVSLYRINIEKGEGIELAAKNRFGISSVPVFALVLPKQEEIIAKWFGYNSPEDFIKTLNEALQRIPQKLAEYPSAPVVFSDSPKGSDTAIVIQTPIESFSEDYLKALRTYRALAESYRRQKAMEKAKLYKTRQRNGYYVGEAYNYQSESSEYESDTQQYDSAAAPSATGNQQYAYGMTPSGTVAPKSKRFSNNNPYDLDIFRSLARGRMQFLRWEKPDPLGIFRMEAVIEAARRVLANDKSIVTQHAKEVAEVANELANIALEEKVSSLNYYLSEAWKIASNIEKPYPDLYNRLKANYLMVVKGTKESALEAMRDSFQPGWEDNAEMVLTFSSWCMVNRVNYREASLLAQNIAGKTVDDNLKSKLLYCLAAIEVKNGNVTQGCDTLETAMTLINKYSLRHQYLENQKKTWVKGVALKG
jgi:thiol-disulfide isomerase/thioredoxin